jgi:hypothetical protein
MFSRVCDWTWIGHFLGDLLVNNKLQIGKLCGVQGIEEGAELPICIVRLLRPGPFMQCVPFLGLCHKPCRHTSSSCSLLAKGLVEDSTMTRSG